MSVCGCTGNIYTGLVDGRIIKISKDLKTYSTVLRTGIDSEDCGKGTIALFKGGCRIYMILHFIRTRRKPALYVFFKSATCGNKHV